MLLKLVQSTVRLFFSCSCNFSSWHPAVSTETEWNDTELDYITAIAARHCRVSAGDNSPKHPDMQMWKRVLSLSDLDLVSKIPKGDLEMVSLALKQHPLPAQEDVVEALDPQAGLPVGAHLGSLSLRGSSIIRMHGSVRSYRSHRLSQ